MTDRSASATELNGPEFELIDAAVIDVRGCSRIEFCVGMLADETARGLRFDAWPPNVQRVMEKQAADWLERNPGRAVRCVTTGVVKRNCVMILHHSEAIK